MLMTSVELPRIILEMYLRGEDKELYHFCPNFGYQWLIFKAIKSWYKYIVLGNLLNVVHYELIFLPLNIDAYAVCDPVVYMDDTLGIRFWIPLRHFLTWKFSTEFTEYVGVDPELWIDITVIHELLHILPLLDCEYVGCVFDEDFVQSVHSCLFHFDRKLLKTELIPRRRIDFSFEVIKLADQFYNSVIHELGRVYGLSKEELELITKKCSPNEVLGTPDEPRIYKFLHRKELVIEFVNYVRNVDEVFKVVKQCEEIEKIIQTKYSNEVRKVKEFIPEICGFRRISELFIEDLKIVKKRIEEKLKELK